MSVADRKEREKEEMKARILDAAKKLFLENGFEKTSIRNIAEEIEYSPGTIYLYFKDKNDLLFALHQQAFGGLMESFMNVATVEDPFERLIALGHQYLKFAFENPEMYELMFLLIAPMEALECCNEVWEDGRRSYDLLKIIVTECQQAGYFAGKDIDDLSLIIWSAVHGLASIHLRRRTMIFSEEERLPRLYRAFDLLTPMLKNL
ncbi:MAG: TetR/AcrR family transcriptional regulator [Cytophagaceae bacterium]|nr:TetR/AcrR family transcriptional regulator [Cytophagaceae bacterium]MBK9935334.1 TetR/AcrR family transcriptional regulator [Cytophagaceae bacterium]MBL0301776.1 TetR/AcrR family transcriptional regulator [Cytophagaceae bacterium]MBL0324602.1 TetR/AcrR family transcriptional regulator [Cytophagaceae bacterium]